MYRYRFFIIVFFIYLILPQKSLSQNYQKALGNWSGTISLPTAKLEMIFKISEDESGKLISKLDVPMQGARDLSIAETIVREDSLFLNVALIAGKYEGKLTSDSTVEGTWKQSGMSFPLALRKTEIVTELRRPQTPVPPYPYKAEDVEYLNPISGLKLTGTLTLPENAKNCPAVLMISGSGAQDRDETIFEHKPFLAIADYLTRNGIAVLRVDDRGVGGSEGNISDATSEDFAGDVIAGIEFLKTRIEIDHSKMGLIGHSEGGLIAPMVAVKTNDVAFIVLLAGPGIKGELILYEQGELIGRASGLSEEQISENKIVQKEIFDAIMNESDPVKQTERLQSSYSNGMYHTLTEEQKNEVNARITAVNTPWFRYFLKYDPFPVLAKVKCPVLALNGEKDLQVPPKENLAAIEKALTNGGNTSFKIMELKNLNHLFQTCNTGLITEYAEIEETISTEVLKIIYDWIVNSGIKN